MKPFILVLAVIGVCMASLAPKVQADEQPVKIEDGDVYELRVWMGYPLFSPDITPDTPKPAIDTQIKVGKFFSASNWRPDIRATGNGNTEKPIDVFYVASGVLHPSENGKFPLECAFAWSGRGGMASGPSTWNLELGKSHERMLSAGLVQGFTAILTKVEKPAKQEITPDETQPKL